jgi:urea carboxylase system permease
MLDADSQELARLGYKQELHRTLGSFSSFAAGFSYISILTGVFQLFALAYGAAGPGFWWTWPVVFFGQMMVALCFAELAAHYPMAGSIYSWSKQVAGKTVAWLAGWMMLVTIVVTVAAVALAWQVVLPQISPTFQFIGDGTGKSFAENAVLLGTILIVLTTIVNIVGVRLMAMINNVGVFVELIASVVLIVLLAVHAVRGPGVITKTLGTGHGHASGYLGALLVASLLATYVMWGFETAGSVGEETKDPRRVAPKGILRALAAAGVSGAFMMLVAMMAVGSIHASQISVAGLPFIVKQVLGNTMGNVFLWCAVTAIGVCCLSVHTGAVRVAFAMARDNNLPFGSRLARVSKSRRTPTIPALVIGIIAVAVLAVNINQPQIIGVVTSVVVVLAYGSYLFVTLPMLSKRLRGEWPLKTEPGFFTMGRWGMPVNIIAVVFGAAATINMVWPRGSIYNPVAPFHWYLRWGGVLFCVGIALVGLVWYLAVQRHKTAVLVEHRPLAADTELAADGELALGAPHALAP